MYCWSLAWKILRILSEAPEKPSDGYSSSVYLIIASWGTLSQITQPSCSQLLTLRNSARFGVSKSLQQRRELAVACCWVRGSEYNSVCTSPFEGHHYHNYPYHSLPQAKNRERTQPRPPTESWIKDLLSMAPPIRIRPSFPHSQSLPLGRASYSKSLFQELHILIHQRADRMKTTITEN